MKLALTLTLCAVALTGCMTKRVADRPSPAILEARAKAQAAKAAPADRCGLYTFVTSAPVRIAFPYNSAELSEAAREQLDRAAVWLDCRREVWVAVTAQHDNQGTAEDRSKLVAARTAAVKARLAAQRVHPDRVLAYQPGAGHVVLTIEARGRGW